MVELAQALDAVLQFGKGVWEAISEVDGVWLGPELMTERQFGVVTNFRRI